MATLLNATQNVPSNYAQHLLVMRPDYQLLKMAQQLAEVAVKTGDQCKWQSATESMKAAYGHPARLPLH